MLEAMLQARLEECSVPAELEAGGLAAKSLAKAVKGCRHRMSVVMTQGLVCLIAGFLLHSPYLWMQWCIACIAKGFSSAILGFNKTGLIGETYTDLVKISILGVFTSST